MRHSRPYLLTSGALFAVVGVLHLVRGAMGVELVIGAWAVPSAVSWLGGLGALILAAWAFHLAQARRHRS